MQKQDLVETLEHALDINKKRSSPNPIAEDATAHSPLVSAKLYAALWKMSREEAKRVYAKWMQIPITQATEDALSNPFRTNFELLKDRSKTTFYS